MQITLLCVGKLKAQPFRDGVAEYAKRLGRYTTLKQVDVKEERGNQPVEIVLAREGERLLQALPNRAFAVALDPTGQTGTSEDLAKRLSSLALNGKSRIAFLIGGAFGLSDAVFARADIRLSLSRMTFPHELARLILVEQLYRAFTIQRGEPYHK